MCGSFQQTIVGEGTRNEALRVSAWAAKPVAPCTRDISRAFNKLQGIDTNLDWFIALFAHAVIGRRNYFGICFSTLN